MQVEGGGKLGAVLVVKPHPLGEVDLGGEVVGLRGVAGAVRGDEVVAEVEALLAGSALR